MANAHRTVRVGGRSVRVSSLDKVLYPADGTTKGDVIGYFGAIAPVMLPHCRDRAATRKRWPGGVGETGDAHVFFQKDIGDNAPEWVATGEIQHRDHVNAYPLVNDEATLVWLAQLASLEIHVPQWRFDDAGRPCNPDRMVLDLDPGPGVDLRQCARVAFLVRDLLRDMGLEAVPVTSGSKGIHLYAALDGSHTSDQVSAVAHELARALEADHPDEVTSTMRRAARAGKVFIDWSQNNPAKTTVAPYSLRGRARPTVAAPRTWGELASPHLRQLEFREVLQRVERRGDPMASLDRTHDRGLPDRLEVYRAKRDPGATPEPVPEPGRDEPPGGGTPVFVIQRHEARRLHHDFRLEHDGVLVSWALPKGVPTDPERNRLAVPTEDHPLSYRSFEGTIPKGEYGAGEVRIWDSGTFALEKWRDDEVIATLHGSPGGGLGGTRKFALFRTRTDPPQWMIHLMATEGESAAQASEAGQAPEPTSAVAAAGDPPEPMLATRGTRQGVQRLDPEEWAFEMKWDGMRVIAALNGDRTTLTSRSGADVTAWFPELNELRGWLDADQAILDGEVVAFDGNGSPSFSRLQSRMGLERDRDVERARRDAPVALLLFDVLAINGRDCRRLPYSGRRELLEELLSEPTSRVAIPPAFDGRADAALDFSRERGLEGIVAKRRASPYRSGARSDDWVKLPRTETAEAVVIGWRESEADPSGFASLLLAVPDEDSWCYAGRVSSGFRAAERRRIRGELARRERATPALEVPSSDQRDAHWVMPRLVAEVSYRERTPEGRFRHPVWRGFRPDKHPEDIT